MAADSHEIEAIVRNWCFFMDFDFVCGDEGGEEGITYPVVHFSVHGKHNGVNFESVSHSIHKLLRF